MSHIKISVNAWGVTDSYFSISILKFLVTLYLTVNRRGDSVWVSLGYLWVASCKVDM